MADEKVAMDDRELFQSAMATEEKSEEAEQLRDEQGRFAPKEEVKAEEPKAVEPVKVEPIAAEPPGRTETEPKDDAAVPPWRLKEIRAERDATKQELENERRSRQVLQEQFHAMQTDLEKLRAPKAEPVDFFADPDNALKQNLDPLRSEFQRGLSDIRLEMSRELAVVRHGEPAVKEMESAIAQAIQSNHPDVPTLAARMRSSNNPASVAMEWHKNQKLVLETGGDLAGYRTKILDEAMKDPAFMAKAIEAARTQAGAAPVAGRPAIDLPPSLNKAAGSGANEAQGDADMSDRGLFRHAMGSRR